MQKPSLTKIIPTIRVIAGALAFCLGSTQVVANEIVVTLDGTFSHGVTKLVVHDGANQVIDIKLQDGTAFVDLVQAKTDSKGDFMYPNPDLQGLTAGATSFEIIVGGDTYKDITKTGS